MLPMLLLVAYKWVNPPLTPLMVQRFFQQMGDKGRKVNFERDYVSIDEISPNLVTAVISSEDGRFMRHKGFDIPQLKQSYRETSVASACEVAAPYRCRRQKMPFCRTVAAICGILRKIHRPPYGEGGIEKVRKMLNRTPVP